jgi:hypothetical protein
MDGFKAVIAQTAAVPLFLSFFRVCILALTQASRPMTRRMRMVLIDASSANYRLADYT